MVHQVFDTIARVYDPMNLVLTMGLWRVWQRRFARVLAVKSGQRALDVACGTGDLTRMLAERVGPTGHVVGIDLSERMLEVARGKLAGAGLGNVTFQPGNALALPFADASFDVCTIGFALRNVTDIPATIREMARVTRPGGRVLSLELSHTEVPIFRSLFALYFYHLVPWMGRLVRHGKDPYAWLALSLRSFPPRRELEAIMREAGLVNVSSIPLTLGVCAIHQGEVPR